MIKHICKHILKHKKMLQAIFGTVLLVTVIWQSDPRQLLLSMQKGAWPYFIPWMMFYIAITVFSWAAGLYGLLVRINSGGFKQLLAVSFKLQVISVISPGRLGDLGLLYYLKQRYTLGQISGVVLVDKLITLLVSMVLALLGFGVFFSWKQSGYLAIFFVFGFLILFWLILKFPRSLLHWKITDIIIQKLQGIRTEISATLMDVKGLGINLVLTVFRSLFAGISLMLMLYWFDVTAPLFQVILIQAISQLVVFLPLTVMGIGVQEALHVYLFGLIQIPAEVILAVMLWGRAIHLLIILGIYGCWMLFGSKTADVI